MYKACAESNNLIKNEVNMVKDLKKQTELTDQDKQHLEKVSREYMESP